MTSMENLKVKKSSEKYPKYPGVITVVIPAYNEKRRIVATLREIELFIKECGWIREVVVVDDGSRDATVERALYFKQRILLRVVRLAENVGKWAAIHEGLRHAQGLVLLIDADHAAKVSELVRLGGVPERGCAVFGSRYGMGASVRGKSAVRRVVSWVYRIYVSMWYWIAGGRESIDDMQCPWKLFWKEDVVLPLRTRRFAGDVEFALRCRASIVNHSVEFEHMRGGTIGWSTVWEMLWSTPRVAWRNRNVQR